MARSEGQELVWGTDGVPSMPKALDVPGATMIDMEGFVFTPFGLRVNMTDVDREELLRSGYGPGRSSRVVHDG